MFSYTDDAIVTSSPTGRHLSTVIRRPAAIGPLDWSEHADRVCKVLNELDSKAKANSLSLHMQTVGRVKRTGGPIQSDASYRLGEQIHEELRSAKRDWRLDEAVAAAYPDGPTAAKLIEQGGLNPVTLKSTHCASITCNYKLKDTPQ